MKIAEYYVDSHIITHQSIIWYLQLHVKLRIKYKANLYYRSKYAYIIFSEVKYSRVETINNNKV